jgi:uncharacterized tellurite resistance protein B-like protein
LNDINTNDINKNDILKKLNKAKESVLLCNHPLVKYDLHKQFFYIRGLSLMMNVDNDIHEAEKDYILGLCHAMELDESKIDSLIEFSENHEEKEVVEIISEISKDDLLKKYFTVDLILLSWKDDKLKDEESKFIDIVLSAFSFSKEEDSFLRDVATAALEKNKDLGTFLYLENKKEYKIFDWLLKKHGVDAECHLKVLHHWDFVTWSFEGGSLFEGDEIAQTPVSNEQLMYFLNTMLRKKYLKKDESSEKFLMGGKQIIDLEHSLIFYEKERFKCDEAEKNKAVTGITTDGALSFVNWVNEFISEYEVDIIKIDGYDVVFDKSCIGKPLHLKEIFFYKYTNQYRYFCGGNFGRKDNNYTRGANVTVDNSTTFRLMKKKLKDVQK